MTDRNPRRIGDVLRGASRGWGIAELADAGHIGTVWPDIVGADIAAHVTPTSLRGGVLRIRAESAIWATEVGYLVDEIALRINRALNRSVVSEVRVWTSPSPTERASKRTDTTPIAVVPTISTPPADDPETAFEKARAAWIRRRRVARFQGPSKGESPR